MVKDCDNLCFNWCISSSDLPKAVDVCSSEIFFCLFSETVWKGYCVIHFKANQFKSNAMTNNIECTGFLMWLPCY